MQQDDNLLVVEVQSHATHPAAPRGGGKATKGTLRLGPAEQAVHTAAKTAQARRSRLLQVRAAEKEKAARQSRAYRATLQQRAKQQVAVLEVRRPLSHLTTSSFLPHPPHDSRLAWYYQD
jgi:hypothetical protein